MKLVTLLFTFISTTIAVRVCRRCTYNGEYSEADTAATCRSRGTMRKKYCVTDTAQDEWSRACVDEGNCWNSRN
ncbi:hypothetical protein LY78DRAFT_595125 [Colletotrichum sublineola]|nr:hypothetical protein LY78DRAFT_595125 [Colletotrichum sublineola]